MISSSPRADDVDADPAQLCQIPAIGEFLEDHRVARFEQHLVDKVDRLARTRRDQHVVGGGLDAAPAAQLVGDELAQPAIALRPLRQAVERQILPLAAQHRGGRLDQALDRNEAAVVVPADEVVFGVAGPARRRRRHVFAEQIRIGETGAAHCVIPLVFGPSFRPAGWSRAKESLLAVSAVNSIADPLAPTDLDAPHRERRP